MFIDLVDGDDHLDVRRVLDELDHLLRLRHHPIIRRDDEHDDIRHPRPSSPHRFESGVSRGVEEADRPRGLAGGGRGDRDGERSNVLGDPSRFAFSDRCFSKGVEQSRLSVIYVTLLEQRNHQSLDR